MPGISYQLYCSRNFPPLEDTLSMLSKAGYRDVEGYGGVFGDAGATRAALDAAGLSMPTGHFALDLVETDPAGAMETARTLGIGAIIVPHIAADQRPADAAGWRAFGQRLAEAGKPIRDAGFGYGWHNHDFELADLGGGDTPLDLMLGASGDIGLELDLGWVARAGEDPAAWIDRHAGRLIAVHVKDIAPEGEAADEDGWADVGHGIIDWAPIVARLKAAGVDRYVIEHDNPSDHARFATRSLETVKEW